MHVGLNTVTAKIAASVAVLGAAATVAGLGTFGSFTSATSASQSVTSGTVVLTLGSTNRLGVAVTGVVPGDTIQRAVDLNNTGNQNLATLTLGTAASPSSLLNTSAAMGLTVQVDSCSVAWTEAGVAPAYTYTCTGSTTAVLASTPVATASSSPVSMTGANSLTAGGSDHLRVTLALPAAADNTLQGLTSGLTFTFTGTQRAATNK